MSAGQQAEAFPGRNFYKANGVHWMKFLPWLTLAFVVAVALAAGMAQLFAVGHYYIFIVPLLAALCVAGMLNLAVNKGHCRNAVVGGLAGLCAGVVLYIGYFYFGMVHDLGPETANHPEFVPSYIRLRMAIEVTRDVHNPHREEKPNTPTKAGIYMNWGRFVFELGVVLAITIAGAANRARKPYCQTCQRWTVREVTQFDPTEASELLEALRIQSPRSLAALCARTPYTTIPNISLAVDFCPTLNDGMSRDCPAYVSVKQINMAAKSAMRDAFEQSKGKLFVRGMQLESNELAALAPRFKVFEAVAGHSAVNSLLPKREIDEADDKNLTYAEITPLTQDYAGKILSRKTALVGNAFSLLTFLGLVGGLGLLIWGLVTAFPDHPPAGGVSPEDVKFGVTLIFLGGTWFCISLAFGLIDPSYLGNRYLRNLVRREFSRRSSLMVELNDPEAVFVEVVPKTNWGKMMLDNASDVGLLLVDRSKREIRFEGDKERWRIPVAAITYCQFEEYVHAHGNSKTRIFYVVLRANRSEGFWEVPVRPRSGLGMLSGKRKRATWKLFEAIESIGGAAKQPPRS